MANLTAIKILRINQNHVCRCGQSHKPAKVIHLHGLSTASKVDPTRTLSLRLAFRRDMDSRFKAIRRDIIKSIVINDCFGLNPEPDASQITANISAAPKQFNFPRSSEKIDAFMQWLNEQESLQLLTKRTKLGRAVVAETSWMDTYIESSYKKGILQAQSAMKKANIEFVERPINAAFFRPIHADRVGLLYTRTFSDLKGITDEMDKQISRTLAQGLIDGLNPRPLARILANRVDKIGITRARTLARTEIIRAHAEATLNEFQEAAVEDVNVVAEWLTGGFDVCDICDKDLSGKTFPISEAHGMLPAHPNCKCTWIPKVK